MGCTPSSTNNGTSTDSMNRVDSPRASREPVDETKNVSERVLETLVNSKHNASIDCTTTDKRIICAGADSGDPDHGVVGQDEDSENESAGFLCANLRRNFLLGRNGSSGPSGSSGNGCRRHGSSNCIKQTLTTTTEEQNENFLSCEDGEESNPLLQHRSPKPVAAQSDIGICGTTTSSQSTATEQRPNHPFVAGRKLTNQVRK